MQINLAWQVWILRSSLHLCYKLFFAYRINLQIQTYTFIKLNAIFHIKHILLKEEIKPDIVNNTNPTMQLHTLCNLQISYSTGEIKLYQSWECHASDWAYKFDSLPVMYVAISHCEFFSFWFIIIHCMKQEFSRYLFYPLFTPIGGTFNTPLLHQIYNQ